MFEIAIASVFITAAFVAVGTTSRMAPPMIAGDVRTIAGDVRTAAKAEEQFADLPCPWCLAQTHEDDAGCPSCGQPFG